MGTPNLTTLDQELSDGFPMMGPLTPGLGWPLRTDDNYKHPRSRDQFQQHNTTYTNDCLQRRADQHAPGMLAEILKSSKTWPWAGRPIPKPTNVASPNSANFGETPTRATRPTPLRGQRVPDHADRLRRSTQDSQGRRLEAIRTQQNRDRSRRSIPPHGRPLHQHRHLPTCKPRRPRGPFRSSLR